MKRLENLREGPLGSEGCTQGQAEGLASTRRTPLGPWGRKIQRGRLRGEEEGLVAWVLLSLR